MGRQVTESPTQALPGYTHPEWRVRFPWLAQGTTGRGPGAEPFDLGIFAMASAAARASASPAARAHTVGPEPEMPAPMAPAPPARAQGIVERSGVPRRTAAVYGRIGVAG